MNNAALYNAVLNGVSGSTQNLLVGQSSNADYAAFASRAALLAVEVDSLIPPISGGPTEFQIDLLTQIVSGLEFNRSLGTPGANLQVIAQNIVALYTVISGSLLPSGSSGAGMQLATNMAYLRAHPELTVNGNCYLISHTVSGDRGNGTFYWDPLDVRADNDGTIVKVTSIAVGRWNRAEKTPVHTSWFGARGGFPDSPNNETTAVQNAIDSASATGVNEVILDEGTYLFTDALTIPSNMTFQGERQPIWQMNQQNAMPVRLGIVSTDTTNIKINGITFKGDLNHGVHSVISLGLQLNGVDGFELNNVKCIEHVSEGMHLQIAASGHARNGKINWCESSGNGDGVSVAGCGGIAITSATDVEFSNCTFSNNGNVAAVAKAFGIDIEPDAVTQRIYNITFFRCHVENNSSSGVHSIHRDDNTQQVNGVKFIKCTFGNNAALDNITIAGEMRLRGFGYEVLNCAFVECNNFGINFQGAVQSIAHGNTILGSGTNASVGIYLYGARNCTVTDNTIVGMMLPGIYAESINDEHIIADNNIIACGANGPSFWDIQMNLGYLDRSRVSNNTLRKGQIVTLQCALTAGTVLRPQQHWASASNAIHFTPLTRFVAAGTAVYSVAFICVVPGQALVAPNTVTTIDNGPVGWLTVTNGLASAYYPPKGFALAVGTDNEVYDNDFFDSCTTTPIVDNGVRTRKPSANRTNAGLVPETRPYEESDLVIIDGDVGITAPGGVVSSIVPAFGNSTVTFNAVPPTYTPAGYGLNTILFSGGSLASVGPGGSGFTGLGGVSGEFMFAIQFRVSSLAADLVIAGSGNGAINRAFVLVAKTTGVLEFGRLAPDFSAATASVAGAVAINTNTLAVICLSQGKLYIITSAGTSPGVNDFATALAATGYNLFLAHFDGTPYNPLQLRRCILRYPTPGANCLGQAQNLYNLLAAMP